MVCIEINTCSAVLKVLCITRALASFSCKSLMHKFRKFAVILPKKRHEN